MGTFLLCFIFFLAGAFAIHSVTDFVQTSHKDENVTLKITNELLASENLSLKKRLNNLDEKSSVKYEKVSQFTKNDLKILRNLTHPDKHKNSENAARMFIKINSLLK